ncbi:undecaprenyl pyrophosphate synthetase [Gracilibacillus boraciitolerans JCM 21714]|uniref:Isoprenyl transferase n=1 Tax=Gracilibacillus boraciitolerans JCM 21714 TaxID=1298598 RepID=W4VEG4_9BACI|nr:isoprenyl transferase [Gracilibacillus boraciitolerans]GAE91592.1 undecaprenyl pyrophosphate synthetase [Gracilibacillus boraciitolerans JCM 21714]
MRLFKLPFKNNKEDILGESESRLVNIPKHIAIIMDGNGRWAKKRGLPRVAGHREGMDNVKRIVKAANHFNIEVLTLYAFSTENWKRPSKEVEYIMKLPIDFLQHYLPELVEENVRIQTIGEIDNLPKNTKLAIMRAKEETVNNSGLILNIAINYGSRFEMIQSVKEICQDVQSGKYQIEDITESTLEERLYTSHIDDPDLLIRTSGELRLSNFMLWQAAYTELWFTDTLWPDFSFEEFEKAINDFQKRKRRYGGI